MPPIFVSLKFDTARKWFMLSAECKTAEDIINIGGLTCGARRLVRAERSPFRDAAQLLYHPERTPLAVQLGSIVVVSGVNEQKLLLTYFKDHAGRIFRLYVRVVHHIRSLV